MGLTLARRIEEVQARVAAAAARSGREATDITLVAVSKTVDRAIVDEAYALGLRDFGENRVQDCVGKYAAPLPPDARLHMIGQLQSNKARAAVALFDAVHSVDRESLIGALDRHAAEAADAIDVFVQVNVAGEDQKAGCPPESAGALISAVCRSCSLRLLGLMTMAPLVAVAEEARPVFSGLRELRDRLVEEYGVALPFLSMGMTNDFEIAIEEGATHVRIGRAIFEDS